MVLPYSNPELRRFAENKKAIFRAQAKQHQPSDVFQKSLSEQLTAQLCERELYYFREVEKLRKQFSADYGYIPNEIFRVVDVREQGFIDFECLSRFFKKHELFFSSQEFSAFLRRTTQDFDQKVDYQEFIYAITPYEPSSYPAFRLLEQPKDRLAKVFNKMREFGVDDISVETG